MPMTKNVMADRTGSFFQMECLRAESVVKTGHANRKWG